MSQKLLIVDDDEGIRTQLKWALGADYEVLVAEDPSSALSVFRMERPWVVLLDLGLPPDPSGPAEGFRLMSEMLVEDRRTKILVATGQSEKRNALEAVAAGAYDFLSKPLELDELKLLLKRAFNLAGLERECQELRRQIQPGTFEGMAGDSPQIQQVFASVRKVATTDAPVLILGESGTGKELVAHAIHRLSTHRDGPFVPINCSAIPETLLESELFGHEKGAFTGAHIQRKGRIESADGGTLLLDEIGEIPAALQVKLLRFLQEQYIERVGGRQTVVVNTRVVAATNTDLKKAVQLGAFREDLYYRLAVVVIEVPPLRERGGDIHLLANELLNRFAAASRKEDLRFDAEALRFLLRHSWPGNVRELENRIRRGVIMAEGKRLTAQDLELDRLPAAAGGSGLKEAREATERECVLRALKKHSGKISAAAADLGISRPTLYELMEKLGIKRGSGSPA